VRAWLVGLLSVLLGACAGTPSTQERAERATRSSIDDERVLAGGAAADALPPQAVERFEAAVVHMNAGDTAAAEQAFRALAKDYPTYSGPLVNLGILAAKNGRLTEAEEAFKAALERNPRNAAAWNQLGIVYRKQGRFADADRAYQRALELDPQYANAYLNLGVLCDLYLHQPQRALEAYERYLELSSAPDARVSAWVSELRKRAGG